MNENTAIVLVYLLLASAVCFAIYVSGSAWWLLALLLFNVRIGNNNNNKKKE